MTAPEFTRCPVVGVFRDPLLGADRVYTCGQRAGHAAEHNEKAPCDWQGQRDAGCFCTAWADHDLTGSCPTAAMS